MGAEFTSQTPAQKLKVKTVMTIVHCWAAIYPLPLELGWYQTNHYETWYTTSQDTNETVDKLRMVKISLLLT
eukprot:scaffold68924_cov80-Cyclotella_meneghiniana.AAC.4